MRVFVELVPSHRERPEFFRVVFGRLGQYLTNERFDFVALDVDARARRLAIGGWPSAAVARLFSLAQTRPVAHSRRKKAAMPVRLG